MKYPSNRKPRSTAVNVAAAKKAARSKKLAKAARAGVIDRIWKADVKFEPLKGNR